jgi:hypothetical protein
MGKWRNSFTVIGLKLSGQLGVAAVLTSSKCSQVYFILEVVPCAEETFYPFPEMRSESFSAGCVHCPYNDWTVEGPIGFVLQY